MLRKVMKADQLHDDTMEMTATAGSSRAVLFRSRGEAGALALAIRPEAGQEQQKWVEADQRRTSEMDNLVSKLARGR